MRGGAFTRREALGLGAAGAMALAAPALLRPATARAADIEVARSWELHSDLVTRAPYWQDDSEQVLWTTVMRVDDKLAAPDDRWYLWHSTHDTPILRRYSAPSITGPWTEHELCALPLMPSPWDHRHRQCPDIAWDRAGRRFIASIHSLSSSSRVIQNTFMLESADGATWTRMSDAPAVPIGTKTAWDGYAIDYGRFLRDPDGNLARVGGNYVWYYRGTKKIAQLAGPDVEAYQLGIATSPDLVNWTKKGSPILDAGSQRLFGLGSALWLNGVANLVWTVAPAGGSPQVHLQRSAAGQPFNFPTQGPGMPIYADAAVAVDGPSLAVDPATGVQYMTVGAAKSIWVEGTPKSDINANRYAIRLVRATG